AQAGDQGRGEDVDDDLAFLDNEIKSQRAAEPCYAGLLRRTQATMCERNPGWAAQQDQPRPAKASLSKQKREAVKGALETRLAEEGKKRATKRSGSKKKGVGGA
ncbi:unnamed protein product, partial [Discosporangium mesarthrocarpum]